MAHNSFLLKAWSVTLISALFALAAKDSDQSYFVLAYFPAIAFWCLDGYFLAQERLFRALYDKVRKQDTTDFSMDTREFKDNPYNTWRSATCSFTLRVFHGTVLAVVILVTVGPLVIGLFK